MYTSFSHQFCDERFPNTLSRPIPIPNAPIHKPCPPILLNSDTTPGTIHHGRASITDYTMWYFPCKIARDEEKITSYRAPPSWVDRVGMARPELRTVERKEVTIVPQLISPWDNKREVNRLRWMEEKQSAEKRVDEGYESGAKSKEESVGGKKVEEKQGGFSIWSC